MNKKGGFTLIELLAVIVILAIIALIAVPIVLNIIDETKNNATLRSADFYLDAVELSIAQSVLKDKNISDDTYNIKDGDICLNEACTDKLEVEVNGEVPKEGTITITNGNISDLSIVLNEKTIVKNSEGKLVFGDSKKACTYVDSEDDTGDAIGKIDLSDVVTCGTESFYVISNENNKVTMFSKYNLEVGYEIKRVCDEDYNCEDKTTLIENPTNKQSELAQVQPYIYYGVVPFSTELYWARYVEIESDDPFELLPQYGTNIPAFVYDENSNLHQYVSEYERILKEDLKVNSAKATIMSYEQAMDLETNKGNPDWFYSTSYWLGTSLIHHVTLSYVYGGIMDGARYDGITGPSLGVRPVITISTSEIK